MLARAPAGVQGDVNEAARNLSALPNLQELGLAYSSVSCPPHASCMCFVAAVGALDAPLACFPRLSPAAAPCALMPRLCSSACS